MIKVMSIFGTRPEAIKMAPIVLEMAKHRGEIESLVCVTAQHREMLDKGSVMMLTVTEKQFEAMDICLGTRDGPVLDSDSTLVII